MSDERKAYEAGYRQGQKDEQAQFLRFVRELEQRARLAGMGRVADCMRAVSKGLNALFAEEEARR